MRVRRFAALIATAAVVVGFYAAYDPAGVGALWPAAGPAAMRLHALLPIGSGGGTGGAAPTATAPSRPPVVVVVGHAARKDLPWKLEEIGTAQAIASVALRPHFDATVDKVLVADGAAVKAGDTLIELDARQVRAQIDGAKAQLAKDQAALEQAQRDVSRYTDLVARAATPQLNLDNARTAEASGRAAILADRAAIENLEVQLGWYTVTAPISGRVGVVSIKQGNIAKASDNSAAGVFATINQISPIYVAFSVQQSLLPTLHEAMADGAAVEATPQGSKRRATGKLALVDNSVDPTTGTIVARAIFDNADELLWPGQLCNLTLTLRTEPDIVVVPREAVLIGQSGNYVFTVVDGAAHLQPVEVGRTQDGETIVLKGLAGDETVVVDGALLLTEGAKVAARNPGGGAS
ncbi:MAG: efflux RND transporter periplasmic adaptor subunit [Roseiarcus sp.]|jgi:RND family efflux transporter MFP subunit